MQGLALQQIVYQHAHHPLGDSAAGFTGVITGCEGHQHLARQPGQASVHTGGRHNAPGRIIAIDGFTGNRPPGIGGLIVLVALVLFSYTTMLTWGFYGEQSFHYLFGRSSTLPYRVIFLLFIFIGAVGGLEVVWDLADTLNGLMAAPNLIALIVLSGVVARERTAVLSEAAKEKLTKMSAKDRAS